MACEVNNKEINSQCAELLVRPTYIVHCIVYMLYGIILYFKLDLFKGCVIFIYVMFYCDALCYV